MPWDASSLLLLPIGHADCAERGHEHGHEHRHGHRHERLQATGPAWQLAGGPGESVGQPDWGRDGSLRFVSDRTGWWQPYRHSGRVGDGEEPVLLTGAAAEAEAEYHGPDWVLGQQTMAETADGTLVARMTASGRDSLVRFEGGGEKRLRPVAQPCVSIAALCAQAGGMALIGSTPDVPSTVWTVLPDEGVRALRPAAGVALGSADVAAGEPFTLTGRTGRPVHGTLFRPTRHGVQGPEGAHLR